MDSDSVLIQGRASCVRANGRGSPKDGGEVLEAEGCGGHSLRTPKKTESRGRRPPRRFPTPTTGDARTKTRKLLWEKTRVILGEGEGMQIHHLLFLTVGRGVSEFIYRGGGPRNPVSRRTLTGGNGGGWKSGGG